MSDQMSLFDGMNAKNEGIQAVEEHDAPFLQKMRKRAREIAEKHGSLTCDELRVYAQCWNIQPGTPKAWGAIFLEEGWICIGRRPSKWKSNHGRKINVWARKVE